MKLLSLGFVALTCVATAWMPAADVTPAPSPRPLALIPVPAELIIGTGSGFTLRPDTRLSLIQAPAEIATVTAQLRELLGPSTGAKLPDGPAQLDADNAIVFNFDARRFPAALSAKTSPEAHALTVDAQRIQIHARTAAGAFLAMQTLRQLLPPQIERLDAVKGVAWTVPAVQIHDEPRFRWRGLLLDVGRHFFTVAEVKKLIDLMALQKLNVLHWHLTEDQGWRIEIKKYPRLTEVGAWRAESPLRGNRKQGDRVRYGGFYTQDQIKEVVAYAAARFITVMPEIDLPGHSSAAIAAYPELGNSDIPNYAPKVQTRWSVHPYTYAPKEQTFTFIEDVLREVMALFPSRYIHIGGDEAPKTQWKASPFAQTYMREHNIKNEEELQSHFISRVGRFLSANGRQLIGWDEIQEGGVPPGAAVMIWRRLPLAKTPGSKPTLNWSLMTQPLKAGAEIVITPSSHFYLDHYQVPATETANEPEAIGGSTTLAHAYDFELPMDQLTPAEQARIIGLQAALWTEFIWDFPKIEYMMFPRACALAEVAWSPRTQRNFEQFQGRLTEFQRRLDELGVLYHKPGANPRKTVQ
ncbi:MAG: beta-N-acetylhexosaminidase [Opitutae bacterium]|nr:beta-N-acetylhexosaminidase [Opitutae bacterium]